VIEEGDQPDVMPRPVRHVADECKIGLVEDPAQESQEHEQREDRHTSEDAHGRKDYQAFAFAR
jgi:hypothetical protein